MLYAYAATHMFSFFGWFAKNWQSVRLNWIIIYIKSYLGIRLIHEWANQKNKVWNQQPEMETQFP